jgi:hypothetical protein
MRGDTKEDISVAMYLKQRNKVEEYHENMNTLSEIRSFALWLVQLC